MQSSAYIDRVPSNWLNMAATSALVSFGAVMLRTNNSEHAIVIGLIAGAAATIHALTTPIFRELVKRPSLHWYEETGRIIVNLAITQFIVNAVLKNHRSIDFVAGGVVTIALSLIVNRFNRKDLGDATPYVII